MSIKRRSTIFHGRAMQACAIQGAGVADDELPLIFDRFYRSQRMQHEKPTGSGLGLSIAKSICDAHQASIWAVNTEDGLAIHIKLAVE